MGGLLTSGPPAQMADVNAATGTGAVCGSGITRPSASSRVTVLRLSMSASGTWRTSASLDGTVVLTSSVVCISPPIDLAIGWHHPGGGAGIYPLALLSQSPNTTSNRTSQ